MESRIANLDHIPQIFYDIYGDVFGEYDFEDPFYQDGYLYSVSRIAMVRQPWDRPYEDQSNRNLPCMGAMFKKLQRMKLGKIIILPEVPEEFLCPNLELYPDMDDLDYCDDYTATSDPVKISDSPELYLSADILDILRENKINVVQSTKYGTALRLEGDGFHGYVLTMRSAASLLGGCQQDS